MDISTKRLIDTLTGTNTYEGCGQIYPQSKYLRKLLSYLLPSDLAIYRKSNDKTSDTWRHNAYTLQGVEAMYKIASILNQSKWVVDGDFMECGVWRGGVGILAAEILGNTTKKIILVDSFKGLPKGDTKTDDIHGLNNNDYLSVSAEVVKNNFWRLKVNDRNVIYLKGYFDDTLPKMNKPTLSVLHVDADIYSSVTRVLEELYDCVSPGGYVIMDDYWKDSQSAKATKDFLRSRGDNSFIRTIDHTSVYWRKE